MANKVKQRIVASDYIRTSLGDEDGSCLLTEHYLRDVLTNDSAFSNIDCSALISWIEGKNPNSKSLAELYAYVKRRDNEAQIADDIIRPVLKMLGYKFRSQLTLNNKRADYCLYKDSEFAEDFSNTIAIVEAKQYGKIQNKHFIKKQDNSDEIYQCLNYLRTVNLTLQNKGIDHTVGYIILTDGYLWRIYSNKYTHNDHDFASHFIEFNLEAIANFANVEGRNRMVKLFALLVGCEALEKNLATYQKESAELEVLVTTELRQQTFLALEYIATGIWRKIAVKKDPNLRNTLGRQYGIDCNKIDTDPEVKSQVLDLVYNESLVYLLRLLFVLYAEDRRLFENSTGDLSIPKVIKGKDRKGNDNLLAYIIKQGKDIGELVCEDEFARSDDLKLAQVFDQIDQKYNGGLFSSEKHPLLSGLDIDDALFMNAVDNLCRVKGKNGKINTVDFSAVSARELGSIYESLLEYKLAVIESSQTTPKSIVKKGRVRHNVQKNDLELVNHDGERKATGSYYTPDLIVEHLIKTALMPKLEAIQEEYPDDVDGFLNAVLKLKVCDPAMGSGHMIQAAYSAIITFVHQYVEEYARQKDNSEGKNIVKKDVKWDNDYAYWVRSEIARKCIFGVDLNPIAVELAKLIMWMRLFRPDKPFEFFDYNLTCGNSLIGVYDEVKLEEAGAWTEDLFRTQEQVEESIQKDLLGCVRTMQNMPRDTAEEVHAVRDYYNNKVKPMQRQITFFYNIKLAEWLLPKSKEIDEEQLCWENVKGCLRELADGVDREPEYVQRILDDDPTLPKRITNLAKIDRLIRNEYKPLHWRVAFPHIALAGGFDVILTNPPWDVIKPHRYEFFRDYIPEYRLLDTATAKKRSEALIQEDVCLRTKWEHYKAIYDNQNKFYKFSYCHQTVKHNGKLFQGDSNLYKVFIEKVYTILRKDGMCGLVIPNNLNVDEGCTGLRSLLLTNATIQELIMFENRKKLFEIDSRFGYDVLTFKKQIPKKNHSFVAGFTWFDPVWLDGEATESWFSSKYDEWTRKPHQRFTYPMSLINKSECFRIPELQKDAVDVFQRLAHYPTLGDCSQDLHVNAYREFDMGNDAHLFRFDKQGWALMGGKNIHHYDAHFSLPTRSITQSVGEEHLAKKRNKDIQNLRDRTYRIAWRKTVRKNDTRTLICTVIPRGVFVGDSLTVLEIVFKGCPTLDPIAISGVNAVLSSMTVDFYSRSITSLNFSMFILKSLPMPRDIDVIRELGQMAMPLYCGDDFEAFRGGVAPLEDEKEREKLKAKIDARVAHFYGLSYEEYQVVLQTFPLVDDGYKKRCLLEYKEWSFSLS